MRATYLERLRSHTVSATRMLRAGFDVRTVQHLMDHKLRETMIRYLSPDVSGSTRSKSPGYWKVRSLFGSTRNQSIPVTHLIACLCPSAKPALFVGRGSCSLEEIKNSHRQRYKRILQFTYRRSPGNRTGASVQVVQEKGLDVAYLLGVSL